MASYNIAIVTYMFFFSLENKISGQAYIENNLKRLAYTFGYYICILYYTPKVINTQ